MPCTFEACPTCDCNVTVKSPLHCDLQAWITQANIAGSKWGMNPVTFLAIASLESGGNATLVNGAAYGIVQVTQWVVNPYNCSHGTNYQVTDFAGQGPNVSTASGAVNLSFDLLGQFMIAFNRYWNSFARTATAWNGCGCGQTGTVNAFGSSCPAINNPANNTCYGLAAVDIAKFYSGYWIDPSTGQANSYYFGDIARVPAVGPCDPTSTLIVKAKTV